jgi:hypothetical protein
MSDAPHPRPTDTTTPGIEAAPKKGLSMHEDVPVWYDCCSCEAEPYWLEQCGEPPGETVQEQGSGD